MHWQLNEWASERASATLTWLVPCECVGLTTSPGELTGEYGNLAVGWRVGMDVGDSVAGDVVTGLWIVQQ